MNTENHDGIAMNIKLKTPSYHPMFCNDCLQDTNHELDEYYMVHDTVWIKASKTNIKSESPKFLCIGCLEKRLGRELTQNDFTEVPVNKMKSSSERLEERKSRP